MAKYFGRLRSVLNGIASINRDELIFSINLEPETEELIVRLNTKKQLFKGIDSESIPLESIGGAYTDFTVQEKLNNRNPPQPVDRVTLEDTGEFYESFEVFFDIKGFDIFADSIKNGLFGSQDLAVRYGENIVGLTTESRDELIQYYRIEIFKAIRRILERTS